MSIVRVPEGFALQKDGGELYWVLNSLMEVKATAHQTDGAFTIVEIVADNGFGPPPHTHDVEDEAFYVLEGAMTVVCADQQWRAETGAFAFLPKGLRHTFKFEGHTRALQITTPGGFDRFVAEVGRPTPNAVVPAPTTPDIPALIQAAARHGMEIVLPR